MKGRIIFTVILVAVYAIFSMVLTQVTDVVKAQAGVGQLSNDPAVFVASRALARYDLIGNVVGILFVLVLALTWGPTIWRWRRKNTSGVATLLVIVMLASSLAACKPYNASTPVEIAPNQTAFMLPSVGDTTAQEKFDSVGFLQQNQVASKVVEITYREHKVGRAWWSIDFIPNQILILVDRSPVSRQWTWVPEDGSVNLLDETNRTRAAIPLESRESIGFWHGVVINAVIEEDDAATFLYYYGGAGMDPDQPSTGVHLQVGLQQVIDNFMRGWVADKLYPAFKELTLEECQVHAGTIFAGLEEEAKIYFKHYGITVLDLGGVAGLVYDDPEVQNTINEKFEKAAQATSQAIENARQIDIAKAGIQIAQANATQTVVAAQANAESLQKQGEKLAEYPGLTNWVLANASRGYVPQILVMEGDNTTSLPFPFWMYPALTGTPPAETATPPPTSTPLP